MRKVTEQVCNAFLRGQSASVGNTRTDGKAIYLHGNLIAEWLDNPKETNIRPCRVRLTDAGWQSATTKERLNGLMQLMGKPYRVFQRDYCWKVSGSIHDIEWPGELVISYTEHWGN